MIIIAAIVLVILYLKLDYKYKKAAMAIFMIILISFGGIRAYEKNNVLEVETPTLNGIYSEMTVYPTADVFSWNVVKHNQQNTSYIVSNYNTLSNHETNIKLYNTPSIENGSYSSAQNAIKIANNIPVVERFKWNSYYALIDSKYNSTMWNITYYDILKSYANNNITVSVP